MNLMKSVFNQAFEQRNYVQSNAYYCSIKPWDLMRLDQADFGVFWDAFG
jgi:hypothetical protein